MSNTSINLEKEKAVVFRGGEDYGNKMVCWLSKHAADLYPT